MTTALVTDDSEARGFAEPNGFGSVPREPAGHAGPAADRRSTV